MVAEANLRIPRNPSRIDGKCGDHFLQDDSLLIGVKQLNEPMMVVEMETFRANLPSCG
jgi:hypothetical protein